MLPDDRQIALTAPQPVYVLVSRRPRVARLAPFSDAPWPYTLPAGRNVHVWIDAAGLARHIQRDGLTGSVQLRGVARDELGHRYVSEPMTFDIDMLANQDHESL